MRESASIAKLLDAPNQHFVAERRILTLLDLPIPSSAFSLIPDFITPSPLTVWYPPDPPLLKLNYDGASKKNPGLAGFGGVFRNAQGIIMWIYYGNLGHTTNNVAEFQALAKGLDIAKQNNFWPLLVEGDSHIATQACKKI